MTKQVLVTTVLAVGVSGAAFAAGDTGDNSMNPFIGESWAHFYGGHNLGNLNEAQAPRTLVETRVIKVAPAANAKVAPAPGSRTTPVTNE